MDADLPRQSRNPSLFSQAASPDLQSGHTPRPDSALSRLDPHEQAVSGQSITDPTSPAYTPGVPRPAVLKALTSVRFFAALHVALYHMFRPFARWGILAGFVSVGFTGVSFFFFLSGFILTYAHAAEYERHRGNAPKFWIARFARIYPVYLLSMLIYGLLAYADFRNPLHAVAFLADLLLVQSWSARMVNFFNGGAWTLSVEAFFYLTFPFVLLRMRPRTRTGAFAWLTGAWLLAMLVPSLELLRYPAAAFHEPITPVRGALIIFTTTRLPILALPEFLAGIATGWLFLRFKPSLRTSARLAWGGALLLAALLLSASHLPYIALHNGLLIPAYAMLLIGLSQPNLLTRLLSGSWLVLLGEASFALYLFHILPVNLLSALGFPERWRTNAPCLLLAIAFSVAVHLYVERPGRRLILAWWARRHPSELRTVRSG